MSLVLVVDGAAADVLDGVVDVVIGATDVELEVEGGGVLDVEGVVELELGVVLLELVVLVELLVGVVDDVDCEAKGKVVMSE